jgi:hypothetical protein
MVAEAKAEKMREPMGLDEIRAILSDEIDRLRSDESTPAQANAITNAVGKILSTVKLEMEYQRLTGRKANIALLNGSNADPEA